MTRRGSGLGARGSGGGADAPPAAARCAARWRVARARRAAAIRWPAAGRSCRTTSRSIGVPMFGNRTPYSPLEQMLHREGARRVPEPRPLPGAARRHRRRRGGPRRHHRAWAPRRSGSIRPSRRRATASRVTVSVSLSRRPPAEDAVGEPGAELQRRVRAGQRRRALGAGRRPHSSTRSAPPSIASAPTSRVRSSAPSSRRSSRMTPAQVRAPDRRRRHRADLPARERRRAVAAGAGAGLPGAGRRGAARLQRRDLLRPRRHDRRRPRRALSATSSRAARTLPMMAPRRVVIVHDAEALLAPKRAKDDDGAEAAEPRRKRKAARRRPRSSRPTCSGPSRLTTLVLDDGRPRPRPPHHQAAAGARRWSSTAAS